jgi:streptogramin lyase
MLMTLKPDVDPKTGKLDSPIELGGKPEFLAADGKGNAYINLVDKNEVVAVDLKARKVTARWSVAPGGSPVGMAMDTKKRLLYIGCRNPQKLVVMSAIDGKIVAALPIGAGVDATKLDGDLAFASCADGSLAVARETSPGKFEIVQTVKTPAGARTMGVDPTTHLIYLPTSELEAPAAGARPRSKPGTFMIVVVGRAH